MKYEIKRGNEVILNHEINGVRTKSAPAVDFIDIEFDYPQAILFKRNDTIVFKGETYFCDSQYNATIKKGSNTFNHRARFVADSYKLTEIMLKAPNERFKVKFEIEADLEALIRLAVDALNLATDGKRWSYTPVDNTTTQKYEIEGESVMSFLIKVSGSYELPFTIKDRVISFKNPTHANAGTFRYGKGKGFLDLKLFYNNSVKIANTIYGIGGDDLELNTPEVDFNNIAQNGVIEGVYINSEIIPTTRWTVDSEGVGDNDFFSAYLPYSIINNKIEGQSPIVNFETGALAGVSFFADYIENQTFTTITLRRRMIDGEELPSDIKKPRLGDFFNITDIKQPQEVIDVATAKLKAETAKFLKDSLARTMRIEVSVDPLHNEDIQLNNRILVVDESLGINDAFIVNEIRENLQKLNQKEISLEYSSRWFLRLKLLDVVRSSISQLYARDNSARVDFVEGEIQPIREDVRLAFTTANTAESNANNALYEINVLTPRVATVESEIQPIRKDTTLALANSNTAISEVNVLTPRTSSLESVTKYLGVDNNVTLFNSDVKLKYNIVTPSGKRGIDGKVDLSNAKQTLVYESGILVGGIN